MRLFPLHSPAVSALLGCVLACGLVVAALSLSSRQSQWLFAGLSIVLGLVVLMAVPVHTLPAVALVFAVAIPDRVADFSVAPLVNPATAVLGIWVIRKVLLPNGRVRSRGYVEPPDRSGNALRTVAVLLAVVLVPLTAVAPSTLLSASWTLSYLVAVMGPVLLTDTARESALLRLVLPWVGGVAAAYAILQSSLQANILYTPIYEALGKDDAQHWAVYRSDGSLGHPLVAGMFFAVILSFCVGRWLETRRTLFVALAALNAIGIVATVSRGSYVAAGAGLALVLVIGVATRAAGRFKLMAITALAGAGAYLALTTDAFVERGLSLEATRSVNARSNIPVIAADTARAYRWLGGGPASSANLAAPYNFQGLPIENSYLQLLVSIGLPGLVLFTIVLVGASVMGLRARNFGAVAAMVAYAVASSGFAALDTRRVLLVVLGVLIMLCLHRDPQSPPTAEPAAARPDRRPAGRRSGRLPILVGISK